MFFYKINMKKIIAAGVVAVGILALGAVVFLMPKPATAFREIKKPGKARASPGGLSSVCLVWTYLMTNAITRA